MAITKEELYAQDVPMKHRHKLEAVNQVLPDRFEIETIYDYNEKVTDAVVKENGEPVAHTGSRDNSNTAIVEAVHLVVIESFDSDNSDQFIKESDVDERVEANGTN